MTAKKRMALSQIFAGFTAALLLSACSESGAPGSKQPSLSNLFSGGSSSLAQDTSYTRSTPPLVLAVYSGENQTVKEDAERSAIIDLSNVAKGYVAVSGTSPEKAKIMLEKGEERYVYNINNTGEFEFFPFSLGNGDYSVKVYFNLPSMGADEYELFLATDVNVALESEFAPFMVQSQTVNYDENSAAVAYSYELAKHSKTDAEVVSQIYEWIADNIKYDSSKAENVASLKGYVPNPDETFRTGTGICYDYASLAAAMLRANGIACQLIKGNVSAEEGDMVYHAWNQIWLKEGGSITVKIAAPAADWMRIDLTFASSNDPSIDKFIGNAENYYPFTFH